MSSGWRSSSCPGVGHLGLALRERAAGASVFSASFGGGDFYVIAESGGESTYRGMVEEVLEAHRRYKGEAISGGDGDARLDGGIKGVVEYREGVASACVGGSGGSLVGGDSYGVGARGGAVVEGGVTPGVDVGTASVFPGGEGRGGDVPAVGGEETALKVGKWRRKNLKKKERKRSEENWRTSTSVVTEAKTEAQTTLEAKWVVENKLKAAEAKRKLQLLEMQDVTEVAKLQDRKLKAAGERAMVQIEKSHATLAATGNVPGVVPKGGYCTTVVDDPGLSDGSSPSCTISPDSSASMQEFRECQLALADERKKVADLEKLLSRREKAGRMNREDSVAEFTAYGSEVGLPASLCEVLDKKCGQYEYEGLCDGKHMVRAVRDLHFGFEEDEDVIGMLDPY